MAKKYKVDFTGVESYRRCPEGEHLAKLKKIELGTVQGSGDDCFKAVFEVIKGDGEGCQVFETFSLNDKALWKLKSFLEAVGVKANGKIELDLNKLEGKICIIDVIRDEYNGQKRAKIASYIKAPDDSEDDEDDEDDDEEEKPVKKTAKAPAKASSSKSKRPPEDDDDDEDEDEDDDEDEDEDEDEPPVKKSKKPEPKSSKKTTNKKSAKSKKDEDDDDDEDDWEEDDD